MKQFFPAEIIRNSAENYFIEHHSTSRVVYLVLLLMLFTALFLLPIITVDITTQSNGVIRSRYDDNILLHAGYGEVIRANIFENGSVVQGDTLLVISTQKTDEQINLYKLQLKEEIIHPVSYTHLT